MKYHTWLLQRFVSLSVDAEQFANDLTLKACEVEEVIQRSIPDSMVIWYVTDVQSHPDADKLVVCQVDCGSHGQYQIITWWENVTPDSFVPVALPWTYMEKLGFTIDSRKMRWLESNGMICSKGELGIDEDEDKHWIRILQYGDKNQESRIKNTELKANEQAADFDDITDADLGTPLAQKYPRLESVVLDVDNKTITHRPDLTGHFGLAVEARTLYPDAKGTIDSWVEMFQNTDYRLQITDNSEKLQAPSCKIETDKVYAYSLLSLRDVSIWESSFFTRLQLLDLGHKPTNNWVDFSNIFMYLTGQPIHFFDADLVKGDIVVRQAKDGEKFMDLADEEHVLTTDDIVIADSEKILALAGIIGAKSSAVHAGTKNILAEIANFDPVQIRKTWTRLGLRTDAELRFEKHINPLYSLYSVALLRDALGYYSKDLWSHTLDGQRVWYNEGLIDDLMQKKVVIDYAVVDSLLYGDQSEKYKVQPPLKRGELRSSTKHTTILEKLWFVCHSGLDPESMDPESSSGWQGDIGMTCNVPVWRSPSDINIQADMIEEIARHVGYDSLPFAHMTQAVERRQWVSDVALRRNLESISVHDLRADQLETYPRVAEKILNGFSVDKKQLYTINNPLAPEQRYLRDDLVYNLLSYTAKNSKFFDHLAVWDIWKVWNQNPDFRSQTTGNVYAKDFVGEKNMWWYMLYEKSVKSWEDDTFLKAKSVVLHVLKQLKVESTTTAKAGWASLKYKNLEFLWTDNANYHPKKQANIVIDWEKIGFVGTIHPLQLVDHKIAQTAQVTYLTLDCSVLENYISEEYASDFATLQDQIVQRDINFVVDRDTAWSVVTDAVSAIDAVDAVSVFDLYQGDKLAAGKKSIALRMDIVWENMTTEQINDVMKQAIRAVEKIGGKLRE